MKKVYHENKLFIFTTNFNPKITLVAFKSLIHK